MKWTKGKLHNYYNLGVSYQPDDSLLSMDLGRVYIGLESGSYHMWKVYAFTVLQAMCFYVMGWGFFYS